MTIILWLTVQSINNTNARLPAIPFTNHHWCDCACEEHGIITNLHGRLVMSERSTWLFQFSTKLIAVREIFCMHKRLYPCTRVCVSCLHWWVLWAKKKSRLRTYFTFFFLQTFNSIESKPILNTNCRCNAHTTRRHLQESNLLANMCTLVTTLACTICICDVFFHARISICVRPFSIEHTLACTSFVFFFFFDLEEVEKRVNKQIIELLPFRFMRLCK